MKDHSGSEPAMTDFADKVRHAAEAMRALFEPTPLQKNEHLSAKFGADIWLKREDLSPVRSYKLRGAFNAMSKVLAANPDQQMFVCASAGNHGLSLAFGAKRFGAEAVVYIADTVTESFADRLRSHGATVMREGKDYEAAMGAAMRDSEGNGWTLLSDSSWAEYYARPHRLMEGYLVMAAEAARQMPAPPTHIFLQAGVGGLACACAVHFREVWGDAPQIIVVEPDRAPALEASIRSGDAVETTGPVSAMGRLDCKVPSLIALKQLAMSADEFALITEDEAQDILPILADQDLSSTPSGAAGLACLREMNLGPDARALCFLSEQADD